MPHAGMSKLASPTIEPLRNYISGRIDQVSKNTLIQISTENSLHKIYFTTDGSKPDAFNRNAGGRERTHKYRAPFALKPGPRTIRAVAYTRNGKQSSDVAKRDFDVLRSDTDLSEIGEEDEALSSTRSPRLSVRDTPGISGGDGGAATRGRVRYMERLRRHLDEGVSTTSDSEGLDFETPRSVREMLDEIETPHSARRGGGTLREEIREKMREGLMEELRESELSSSEQQRLQELEEQHRFARENEAVLLGRELDAQRAADDFRRECARTTGCADCEEDDGRTHITDFFYTPTERCTNYVDKENHYNGVNLSSRSNGSGTLSDRDYGITGVTRRADDIGTISHSRQERPISEHLSRMTDHVIDDEYRRQVDNELMDHVRASREQRQPNGQISNGHADCPECCASTCCNESCALVRREGNEPQAFFPNTPRFGEDGPRGEYATRRLSRSRSSSHSRSRSRSCERATQGILKRGRSLERARSHERERLIDGRRQSRSRSHSAGRRRSLSREHSPRRSRSRSWESPRPRDITDLIDIKTLEENTGRIRSDGNEEKWREELYVRKLQQQNGDDRRFREDNGSGWQIHEEKEDIWRFRDQNCDNPGRRPSRSRKLKVIDLGDAELSLEELDARLSQFHDSEASVITDYLEVDKLDKYSRQSVNTLKKRKDSANLKKSAVTRRKPAARPPSPPFSAISSSLSSSEAEEEEKEDRQEKIRLNGANALRSKVIVPKVHNVDKQSRGFEKSGKKTGKGALNFFNDSGTQINFWGVSPDEIAQHLRENPGMQSAVDAVHAAAQSTSTTQHPVPEEESENDDAVDQFFITEPRRRRTAVQAAREAQTRGENSMEADDIVEPVGGGNACAGPVAQSQQQEQHSFLGKVGEMVKGFFGGKKADPKNIVKVDYEAVKRKCGKSRKLWEDPDFPAEDESLYHTDAPSAFPFEWKRPHEICKNPQYIVDGASRFDVKQGVLGNCWLLAAVASLAGQEPLLYRVISPNQSFQKDYAGIFRFRFWQYGEWVEVCVDDRLPTKGGKLVYMHSAQQNEFWSPLLEKAYAKLNGCYENLSGGLTSEALTDFTGGLIECFNFREELPDNMFQILRKAFDRGSLMGCSIDAAANAMEQQLESGLIIGHAYSITDIKKVSGRRGQVQLVRVRNPWGNHCEWNGAWSDRSNEWQALPEKTRQKLGITTSHDGEFWMSIRDFTTHFQRVEVCNQIRSSPGSWESNYATGAWVKNVSAGGCRNFPDTYPTNPQFQVQVTDVDDDDDEQVGTLIIALMQKARRRLRPCGGGNLTIGYDIFEVGSETRGMLGRKFFQRHPPVATSPQYINTREVSGRHRLAPGNYCVVPTSFDCNEEADFLMRIFSEKEAGLAVSDAPTSVNTRIAAKTMSVAHAAPGTQRKSQQAEREFRARAGEDLELDAFELLSILNTTFAKDFSFGNFNINSCRSMVAIRDTDATGMLSLEEFKSLWDDLVMWKRVFQKQDKDESGFFSSFELRQALNFVGYSVSNVTFKNMVMRYSDQDGHIQFNDFVDCLVRIKTLFELHERMTQDGTATIPLDSVLCLLVPEAVTPDAGSQLQLTQQKLGFVQTLIYT